MPWSLPNCAQGIKAWNRLNGLFNWLPLAASIEDRVLCMHGGIGRSIHSVEQIEELQVGLRGGGVGAADDAAAAAEPVLLPSLPPATPVQLAVG